MTIKGPAIFLAQFAGDKPPFDTLDNITKWAADLGYKGVQIPTWDSRMIDLKKASESKDYCDELKGICKNNNVEISELSTHLQGQLVAVHPAYDIGFDQFAPPEVHNNPTERQRWAVNQVKMAAQASRNLGIDVSVSFPGALLWPYIYSWPPRLPGLVEDGFKELSKRWTPILDVYEENGVDLCYEAHASEDIHDGASWEMFLDSVKEHPRCNLLYDPSHFVLQQLDYLHYIDLYHDRIKMFHVKDAEFNSTGRNGVYGGYADWRDRAGRFRSLGDGQVDFSSIFTKLTYYGFSGWAVLEWECAIKDSVQGAKEGAPFIQKHIITVSQGAFDDFIDKSGDNKEANKKILGID